MQLGVGRGDGSDLIELVRLDVVALQGAAGILGQIERAALELIRRYEIERIGIGFGGPVDAATGKTIRSHQIDGWENLGLIAWAEQILQRPAAIGNDCNVASLAEAIFGAGRGKDRVFFVTVGTGVGGGFVTDGRLDGNNRPAIAEIGHLRPGLQADRSDATVEAMTSGWGIAAAAQARIREDDVPKPDGNAVKDLLDRCGGDSETLTARMVAQAAADGNEVAIEVLAHACQALGWAIAQVITLLAPDVVVIGGGVSLLGEELFFNPIKQAVAKYVFPPLADSYEIAPAKLGELVVVHGALAIARQ